MSRTLRFVRVLAAVAVLLAATTAPHAAPPDIPILVDGVPLDARPVPLGEEGAGRVKVSPGIRFLFGRMLQGAHQVVWDVPVSVKGGGETAVELSLRNAAIRQ